MKVFISWSGNRSRAVAEALNDWLQRVIQAIEPFYTPEMEKGVKWSNEIDEALEGTRFGIVCLTPDNLKSTWIHYETGALSKTKDAVIWTFLHGLKTSDVPQPLGKFHHTIAEKEDVRKLLHTINLRLKETGGNALKDGLLNELFEDSWARLETRLKEAEALAIEKGSKSTSKAEPTRPEQDILREILETVRGQQRQINNLEENFARVLYETPVKNQTDEISTSAPNARRRTIEMLPRVNSIYITLGIDTEDEEVVKQTKAHIKHIANVIDLSKFYVDTATNPVGDLSVTMTFVPAISKDDANLLKSAITNSYEGILLEFQENFL